MNMGSLLKSENIIAGQQTQAAEYNFAMFKCGNDSS